MLVDNPDTWTIGGLSLWQASAIMLFLFLMMLGRFPAEKSAANSFVHPETYIGCTVVALCLCTHDSALFV